VPETETKALMTLDQFTALQKADQLKEVIEANFGQRGISIFNLERIRIPAGGAMSWIVIDPSGEETSEKEIIAAVPLKKEERNYWSSKFGESGGTAPPDCHSDDLDYGHGHNGTDEHSPHKCRTCPRNQWSPTAKGDAIGKDCRETRLLFLLRKGREAHIFPSIMSITPGSLKALDGYLTSISSQMIPYWRGLHRFTLEKATSKTGINYARVKISLVRTLEDKEISQIKDYANALRGAFRAVHITPEEVAAA
jgi:hypothetical protein